MLILPDIKGCTIITDSGFCICMGVPQAVVKQLFYQEIEISDTIGILKPVHTEVYVAMNNQPIANIYCKLLEQIGVKVNHIHNGSPDIVFKGGTKWKD